MTDTIDRSAERPAETAPESHDFQAEVSRLLHLMVHSVYSNKDIFLRELVSNAADACEKLRWRAIAEPDLLSGDERFAITVAADAEARRLTVSDNGIGMDRAELVANLGTIARSGTKAFLDEIAEGAPATNLIGQFGVGFYSAFMVADRVRVTSRKAGSAEAFTWTSDGKGRFEIEPAALDDAPLHGTRVVLELAEDAATYAEPATIERIVREYSAHIPVPILLATAGEAEPKELTDGSALWVKPKAEITKEEYAEFYGNVSGQWDEPALTIHYKAEGRHEYSVLAFVPSMKPFDLFDPARKGRIKLYVRRVFISDEVEILPAWARFVRGVVDSEDLPLNISREMLQKNPVLEAIGKNVTGRVLSELKKLVEADAETFAKVWDAFGPVIKEGLYEDPERRDEIFAIARFKTTTSGDGWRSLADYVADLKDNQTRIYYVTADTAERAAASPHLEGFRKRGVEVLLLSDPVDAFWVRTALGYEGKPFQSITQGSADLDQIPEPEKTDEPKPDEAPAADLAALIAHMKTVLEAEVADIRTSSRLDESPACLVAPDFGPDKQFEKIIARHQGGSALAKPVLELNPRHAIVTAMTRHLADADKSLVDDAAHLLLGQARILDGEAPSHPADFGRRLARVMAAVLG